jgi:hypothetical protein
MAKKSISSTDLVWLIHEKLKESGDYPQSGLSIAIVPADGVGWTALMASRQRAKFPHCAKQIRTIEKQLRETYALKG